MPLLYKKIIGLQAAHNPYAFMWCLSMDAVKIRCRVPGSIREFFNPVHVDDDLRIRTNKELYDLNNGMDVVHIINIHRLR